MERSISILTELAALAPDLTLRVYPASKARLLSGDVYTVALDVSLSGAGDKKKYIFTTPAGKYVHLCLRATAKAQMYITLYDTPTYSGGTPVTTYNRNLHAHPTSATSATGVVIKSGPTVTADGTRKYKTNIRQAFPGGSLDEEQKLVLKPGTTYQIQATHEGATGNSGTLVLNWWEETV